VARHVFRNQACIQCGAPDTGPDSWGARCPTTRGGADSSVDASQVSRIQTWELIQKDDGTLPGIWIAKGTIEIDRRNLTDLLSRIDNPVLTTGVREKIHAAIATGKYYVRQWQVGDRDGTSIFFDRVPQLLTRIDGMSGDLKAFCSWCFNYTQHKLYQLSSLTRNSQCS
jgi:hypothetical protein